VSQLGSPVRLGLIGTGLHGTRYARHIQNDVEEARLVAFVRRDVAAATRLAAELGVPFETDVAALVARSDIDAVVVVTPPGAHLQPCLLALAGGKHVLVEKPMTATLAEALQLSRAVRESVAELMLAQTLRYDAVLGEVRRRLPELGRIVQVRMAQRLEPSSLRWQRDHRGAGAGSILLTGVHLFDTVRWLLDDEIATVFCQARAIENPYSEDFFAASVSLEQSGIHADLEISKYTRSRSCRIEVVGERGQLLGDYWNHRLYLEQGREQVEQPLGPPVMTVEATVRDFCRCLLAGLPMPITVEDGRRTLEIVEACHRSAETGQPAQVELAPAEPAP
jgi:predicted dehydrogenase